MCKKTEKGCSKTVFIHYGVFCFSLCACVCDSYFGLLV